MYLCFKKNLRYRIESTGILRLNSRSSEFVSNLQFLEFDVAAIHHPPNKIILMVPTGTNNNNNVLPTL